MVDQIVELYKNVWKEMISPFTAIEYDGRKLQLWDLTKQIFEKHLKYEG